jgi:hypothetical protein
VLLEEFVATRVVKVGTESPSKPLLFMIDHPAAVAGCARLEVIQLRS